MKKTICMGLVSLIFFSACSTMFTSSKESVEVTSLTPGQDFEVKDFNGFVIAKGVTPAKVSLTNYGDSSFEYVTPCTVQFEDSVVNKTMFINLTNVLGYLIDLIHGYNNTPNANVQLANCDQALAQNEKGIK